MRKNEKEGITVIIWWFNFLEMYEKSKYKK